MPDNEELMRKVKAWVPKELAIKYNELRTEKNKRDEQVKMFEDYMQTVKDVSRKEFKNNFESLEEDVAIYTGLMLKVKQAFEKAKNEQLNASYELWEKIDGEIPSIRKKTEKIISEINPLIEKLKEIESLMGKINTYDLDKFISSISTLANLYGTQKEMIEFLINNFKATRI